MVEGLELENNLEIDALKARVHMLENSVKFYDEFLKRATATLKQQFGIDLEKYMISDWSERG